MGESLTGRAGRLEISLVELTVAERGVGYMCLKGPLFGVLLHVQGRKWIATPFS
jgi:hypothetical protein